VFVLPRIGEGVVVGDEGVVEVGKIGWEGGRHTCRCEYGGIIGYVAGGGGEHEFSLAPIARGGFGVMRFSSGFDIWLL